MESCLMCLEINRDILDCIKTGSTQWAELNITKIIEKHFWPLNKLQLGSWICLSCWREVEDFHKFYLRIEEAHINFGEIRVENLTMAVKCKEEIVIETPTKDYNEEEKEKMDFCFIEPEVLIEQPHQQDLKDPEILLNCSGIVDIGVQKEPITSESSDELDDMPLKEACKWLRLRKNLESKDPLEKCKRQKKKQNSKEKIHSEEKLTGNDGTYEIEVKEEPLDVNDVKCDPQSINDNEASDVTYKPEDNPTEATGSKALKVNSKSRISRKENDRFIAKHFKNMFCDICQDPFENFPSMQKHFTDKHNQQGYVVCCKRKFFGRTRLVDHLQSHLNPDHFKCKECGKIMSDRSCFDNHMLRVHRADEVIKRHSCDVCGKSFTKPCTLRNHKLSHLPEEERKFHCSDCGKNYGSSYLLNQHRQAVHLKRFVKICYICGRGINSSAEFKVHMNKHEGVPLPDIKCDICGLRLTSERGLKLHKESQHPIGGKREHYCPICPKVSPTLKSLQKHINTMHKKGYDHKCSICEKAFKRTEALREHMATHTGTALYTCPWCPKTFNSNSNMHAHRKKIHPKEWEESKLKKYCTNILPKA